MMRDGNLMAFSNNMSENQHLDYMHSLANRYAIEKDRIDSLIDEIINKVSMTNPIELFNFITTMNSFASMNLFSEADFSDELNFQLRAVEYIQSILVSSDAIPKYEEEKQEELYHEILALCTEVYSRVAIFYTFWMAKLSLEGDLSDKDEEYIMLSQLMSQVRGNQYQLFRMPILEELLLPLEPLIEEIYGMRVLDILNGLSVLEKNLSEGRLVSFDNIKNQMEKMASFDGDDLPDDYFEESRDVVLNAIGTNLFDVAKNTNWTQEFINDLAFHIGEDKSFLEHEEFAGWPVWNLPIKYKPFIIIGEKAYCFDYYNLFDNFFVSLQKAIRSHGECYSKRLTEIVGHACEKIVGRVFEELLPGCKVHYSNYYSIGGKHSAENDILIEYRDVVIIIEVKAGTYTYTPAIFDFDAHKKSLKTLVEKAEKQCLRVKDYIDDESSDERLFYTDDTLSVPAFSIKKNQYSQLYMIDVTIADFNEFASQIEKIGIADAKEDIIVLSLNDLWIYRDYFDNPLKFIHYLKQRTISTETKEIGVSDELDHLGMYIYHNMYSIQAKKIGGGIPVSFIGYREELDNYYSKRYHGINIEKPQQIIPQAIEKCLEICLGKKDNGVTIFSNFLLDMSDETRSQFANAIWSMYRREIELGRMITSCTFGDVRYVLTIDTDDSQIKKNTDSYFEEYTLAALAKNKQPDCWLIIVKISNAKIVDIQYRFLSQSDIKNVDRERLEKYGDEIAKRRELQFLAKNNKKKIYPNELCLCGSGLKYKKCCGRKARE